MIGVISRAHNVLHEMHGRGNLRGWLPRGNSAIVDRQVPMLLQQGQAARLERFEQLHGGHGGVKLGQLELRRRGHRHHIERGVGRGVAHAPRRGAVVQVAVVFVVGQVQVVVTVGRAAVTAAVATAATAAAAAGTMTTGNRSREGSRHGTKPRDVKIVILHLAANMQAKQKKRR